MTGEELRDVLEYLGLTQDEAARMLGISRRSVISYCTGHHPVPEPIARLLRLIVTRKIYPEDVK